MARVILLALIINIMHFASYFRLRTFSLFFFICFFFKLRSVGSMADPGFHIGSRSTLVPPGSDPFKSSLYHNRYFKSPMYVITGSIVPQTNRDLDTPRSHSGFDPLPRSCFSILLYLVNLGGFLHYFVASRRKLSSFSHPVHQISRSWVESINPANCESIICTNSIQFVLLIDSIFILV